MAAGIPTPTEELPAPALSAEPACDWGRYRDNTARHLIGIARDVQTRAMERLAERGHRGLRPSFGPLMTLIPAEGCSLTSIADQLAISKQAASQLASAAERAGYAERRADPSDGRGRRLHLSRRGRALVRDGLGVLDEIERDYAGRIGERDFAVLSDALAALFDRLPIAVRTDAARRRDAGRSIGVLSLLSEYVQRELMEATAAAGHAGLTMSHGQVLPLIGPGGARIHELARLHGVSRQAVSATAQDLVALGYLERSPDPRDRRGVVLLLTPQGERLLRDSVAALDGLDARLAALLGGEPAYAALQRAARALYAALHLEAEIFEGTDAASDDSLRGLASRLRAQLGGADAARLASFLENPAGRTLR